MHNHHGKQVVSPFSFVLTAVCLDPGDEVFSVSPLGLVRRWQLLARKLLRMWSEWEEFMIRDLTVRTLLVVLLSVAVAHWYLRSHNERQGKKGSKKGGETFF